MLDAPRWSAEMETLICERFPFPIAYLFKQRVLDEKDVEKRVRGIAITFENTLRYLTMVLLGEYARFPGPDETVNQLIEKLDHPSMGHFVAVVQRGVPRLDKRGHSWLLRELPQGVKAAWNATGLPTAPGRSKAKAVENLQRLRNRFAHHEYQPSVEVANSHYPLLLQFLSHFAFLADYPLCRLVAEEKVGFSVVELMGHCDTFATKLYRHPAPIIAESVTPVFVFDPQSNHSLPLHPFITVHSCQDCTLDPALPGVTEEVFLLNGVEETTTIFIGVRHKLELKDRARAS